MEIQTLTQKQLNHLFDYEIETIQSLNYDLQHMSYENKLIGKFTVEYKLNSYYSETFEEVRNYIDVTLWYENPKNLQYDIIMKGYFISDSIKLTNFKLNALKSVKFMCKMKNTNL